MGGPMAGYAVAHLDEIEEFADAGCHYRPIRHHLGVTAFGVTAWTARAAGDLVINEHDEDDPTADQELFLVLRGRAVCELDGDRVDASAGTFVFAPPRTKRTASATEEGTTIIALEDPSRTVGLLWQVPVQKQRRHAEPVWAPTR
jgi:cupin domain